MQNMAWIGLRVAEKSLTEQTNKHTVNQIPRPSLYERMAGNKRQWQTGYSPRPPTSPYRSQSLHAGSSSRTKWQRLPAGNTPQVYCIAITAILFYWIRIIIIILVSRIAYKPAQWSRPMGPIEPCHFLEWNGNVRKDLECSKIIVS